MWLALRYCTITAQDSDGLRSRCLRSVASDEPMAPQIIAACVDKKKCNNSKNSDDNNVKNLSVIKFGSFDVNRSNMKEGIISSKATLSKKLIFKGDNLLKKIVGKKEVKQYIIVGRMQVEITQEAPS